MKKCQQLLSIALTVLLVFSIAVVPVSAADTIKYNVNEIKVKTYQELTTALETKSTETNPKDVYVILENDIDEQWDGYTDIFITYPGNVTLDLNGHKLKMKSPNGDSMFFLKGENATNFSIINTAESARSSIYFYSDAYGSSLINSQNPNANVNIIAECTKYDTNDVGNNAVWNHDISLFTEYASTKGNDHPHYTVYLQKINKLYITGAFLENSTSKATNVYVGETKEAYGAVLITGKSELMNRGYDISGANVYFASRELTGSRFEWLGSCYIQGGELNTTSYKSISATINNSPSFNYKAILLDNSNAPAGSTQMPDKTEVYNPGKITDSKTTVNTYKDIFIRRNCCEDENTTTFCDLTQLGHITKCMDCYSTRSYKPHQFTKSVSRGTVSTCTRKGRTPTYACALGDGCTYNKGGDFLALNPDNHLPSDIVIDAAVNPTCTEKGLTQGTHCRACKKVITAQTDVAALGHKYGNWATVKSATCTEAGSQKRTCSTCGNVEQKTINATGHKFGNWTTVKSATCTEAGSETRTCSTCKKVETRTTNALGHTASNWIVDKKATVNSAGSQHKECTVCGKNLETATIPQLTPGTPKLNTVSNSASGVTVKWSKVSGADSYTVYRKSGSSGWKAIKSGLTGTSYTDKTAKSGTKYTYTVRSVNEAGKGGYDKTGKTILFLSAPKLSSVANSTSGVTVKWSKVAGAKEYYVYRKSGNSGWKKIGTSKGTSYTDKTAKSGTTYTYTVRAYNGKTSSSYNTKGLTIKFLATPKLSSVTSAKSGVTFKWGKVTGASGYYVYRKTGNGSWQKIATVKGNSKVSYLDKSAKKGTTYTYTVRAYNGKTLSAYNTKGLKIKDKY